MADNVRTQCPETCGVCDRNPSPVAPTPPTPSPPSTCVDDSSYRFKIANSSMQACSWILQSNDDSIDQKRLNKWCDGSMANNVRTQCPETCGVCDRKPSPVAPTPPTPSPPSTSEEELLALVNAERVRRDIPTLCFNAKLSQAAYKHSVDMVESNEFSHTGSNGSELGQRVSKENYRYDTVGENIASYQTIAGAHAGLMNSQGHRENILWPGYTQIGLGIVKPSASANFMITQVFALPRPDANEVCDDGSTPRPSPSRRDGSGNTSSPDGSTSPSKALEAGKSKSPTTSPRPTKLPKAEKTSKPSTSPSPTKGSKGGKTSKPSASPSPTKGSKGGKTSKPSTSPSPTKGPKKTKAPKKPKNCKKPKGTKEVEITITLTADGDLTKDDVNYLVCADDEESRKLREVRLLNATSDEPSTFSTSEPSSYPSASRDTGIVSVKISKLKKEEKGESDVYLLQSITFTCDLNLFVLVRL